MFKVFATLNFLCAIISAKWYMELGHSQLRQLIAGLGGLVFGPLMPLLIYVHLLYKAKKEKQPSAKIV